VQQLTEAGAVTSDEPDLELVSPGLVVKHGDHAEAEEGREHGDAREQATRRTTALFVHGPKLRLHFSDPTIAQR
jgi:hypothetical protein